MESEPSPTASLLRELPPRTYVGAVVVVGASLWTCIELSPAWWQGVVVWVCLSVGIGWMVWRGVTRAES